MPFVPFQEDFASPPLNARWTAVEAGAGAVTVANNVAQLACNGSADGDVAALVLDEPMVFGTEDWMLRVGVRVDNPAEAAFVPNLVGFLDQSGGPPGTLTSSQWSARRRAWFENQINDGTTNSSRVQAKFRNPVGTVYNWDNSGGSWTTLFKYSWRHVGPYGMVVLCFYWINGTGLKWTGLQVDNYVSSSTIAGPRLGTDTEYKLFGTNGPVIDEIDNDAYLVIGDLQNNNSDGEDRTLHVEFVSLGEIKGVNKELLWATGDRPNYEIHEFVCPEDDLLNGFLPLWIPSQAEHPDNPVIARGADDAKQDPQVYDTVDDP